MELDKWIGPYKVRAFPWVDGKHIYFNVQYFAPGQSVEKPPVIDRTVYITDDEAGRRFVFDFTHTCAEYVARQIHGAPGNKIVITVDKAPPKMLASSKSNQNAEPQPSQRKHKNQPER